MAVKLIKYVSLVGLVSIVAFVFSLTIWSRDVQPGDTFTSVPIKFNFYDWFDAGVSDINADGFLDLYSSNHDARQSFLLGRGDGQFVDASTMMMFDQDQGFPGLEDSEEEITFSRPGLYVYYYRGKLNLRLVGTVSLSADFSGSLSVSSAVTIKQNKNFTVDIETEELSAGVYHSRLDFSVKAIGEVELEVPYKAVPMTVKLSSEVPLSYVYIGRQMVSPQQNKFTLYLRDRHGIAWSDINDDRILDAFVSRGGLNGKINQFPDKINNEFLMSNPELQFDNVAANLGFTQSACPARQAMWVDYDSDGDLDLYLVCGRQTGGFWEYVPMALRQLSAGEEIYSNQLYERTADGVYKSVADKVHLDFPEGGSAVWLDVDQDGDQDLLWASERGVHLYRNQQMQFEAEKIALSTTTQVRKFALGDFDMDGDLDVFAIAAIGSRLLLNNGSGFESLRPGDFGLPENIKTGGWLDYDNDGLIDFYAWPQGLYKQSANGGFVDVGELAMSSPWSILMDARSLWFDFDNDGDLDVLVLHRYFPHVIQQLLPDVLTFNGALFENNGSTGRHWLSISLLGQSGNQQGLGAKLAVNTAGKTQHQWIGQAESAHYSQGHYRTYFGLSEHNQPVEVTVRWSDGLLQHHMLPVDQHMELSRESHEQL